MKLRDFKNGACTTFERLMPSGMYCVKLRTPSGELADKVVCDTYKAATEYLRAFNQIARNY